MNHYLLRDLDSDPEVVCFISNGVPSDDKEVNRGMAVMLKGLEISKGKFGFWKTLLLSGFSV